MFLGKVGPLHSLILSLSLEDDLNKNWCIGGSHSLCNVFVHQGSIPYWFPAFAHFCVWESNFWGRFISCEFVHLEVVYWMGYWCAACVTQSFFLLPLILFSFAIFNLFSFLSCFTLVVCFWRDRECTCTRFNLSIAFLCSQIFKKFVDLTHFSFQFNG